MRSIHPHVLLVEDSPLAAVATQLILKAEGCTVSHATTAADALQQLDRSHQLILLDLDLPDRDGLDLASAIRQHDSTITPPVPIVILTADTHRLTTAKEMGLDGFLSKPLTSTVCKTLLAQLNIRMAYREFIQDGACAN